MPSEQKSAREVDNGCGDDEDDHVDDSDDADDINEVGEKKITIFFPE